MRRRLPAYVTCAALACGFLAYGLRLDRTDLTVPLLDEADALLILPMVVAQHEGGTHWVTDRLGAPGRKELYDFPVIFNTIGGYRLNKKWEFSARTTLTSDAVDPWLRDLVDRLPEKLRQPVLLHYYADLPIETVAILLDRPAGTVRRQLHEARTAMATDLQREELR